MKYIQAVLKLSAFVAVLIFSGDLQAAEDSRAGYKKNAVGVFGGFTSVTGHTDYTVGLEYERRLVKEFGVGVLWEHTPDGHGGDGVSLYMALAHLHPWKELRLSLGFGSEDVHSPGASSHDVWRAGVAYDFHIGKFGIAPTFNLDRVNGHTAKIVGLVLVKAF